MKAPGTRPPGEAALCGPTPWIVNAKSGMVAPPSPAETPPMPPPPKDPARSRGKSHGKPPRKPWSKPGRGTSSGDGPRPWQQRARPTFPADDNRILIYGLHAIEAAIANPARTIKAMWLTENAERRLAERAKLPDVTIERVHPKDLDRRLGPDTVHQGALAEAEPLPDLTIEQAVAKDPSRPLVLLDQVTDPHNVGAVLRSAAVFGAAAIVMTRRHSPPLSGALAKAASGALDAVPVVLVQNLARTMLELKETGITLIGLDGEAGAALDEEPLDGPIALVLGAEGKGLRELTRESCDRLCRIETDGALASLNVSNAAAVALNLAALARKKARRAGM